MTLKRGISGSKSAHVYLQMMDQGVNYTVQPNQRSLVHYTQPLISKLPFQFVNQTMNKLLKCLKKKDFALMLPHVGVHCMTF